MRWLLAWYCKLLKLIAGLLLGLMLIPVCLQIVSRLSIHIPRFIWTEELARFCFVWIVMVGSMIAVREGTHFDVDLFAAPETPRKRALSKLTVHAAMAVLALVFSVYGLQFASFGYAQNSEMSGINMLWIHISFPIAGFTWLLFLGERIADNVATLLCDREVGVCLADDNAATNKDVP
ncbi:MAG: TRAP transporter small permease [Planctomycetales bacterium]|nr:TRAP transporter small permease [Planctomycetales bacterium]